MQRFFFYSVSITVYGRVLTRYSALFYRVHHLTMARFLLLSEVRDFWENRLSIYYNVNGSIKPEALNKLQWIPGYRTTNPSCVFIVLASSSRMAYSLKCNSDRSKHKSQFYLDTTLNLQMSEFDCFKSLLYISVNRPLVYFAIRFQ